MDDYLPSPFALSRLSKYTVALLTGTCIYLSRQYWRRRIANPNRLPLPPGPPRRIPGVGNAFDMPEEKLWLQFDEWSRQYGEL
jgi:hypothetical protein